MGRDMEIGASLRKTITHGQGMHSSAVDERRTRENMIPSNEIGIFIEMS
jgi:hypothetical protein